MTREICSFLVVCWSLGRRKNLLDKHMSCLPLTRANRSFYGLSKWLATLRTGKFWPRSVYRKTNAKACNWCQSWLSRNGTRISVCNIRCWKTGPPFRNFVASRNLTTPKIAFFLLSIRIFWNLFVPFFCKQPWYPNNQLAALATELHRGLHALISYSKVTWHLKMNFFPTFFSHRSPSWQQYKNIWRHSG